MQIIRRVSCQLLRRSANLSLSGDRKNGRNKEMKTEQGDEDDQ